MTIQKRYVSAFLITIMLIGGVAVSVFPHHVHAGMFSFVSKALAANKSKDNSKEHEVRGASGLNSQTMGLLQAPVNVHSGITARGGGDIFIVGGSALQASGRSGTVNENNVSDKEGRIRVYVVREGDSLSQIAAMFDVSVNTVRWSNDISANQSISPGQKLVILPITGVRHTIEDGDTLSSIADTYNGNTEEIMEYNGIASADSISPGDEIIIPNGEINYKPKTSQPQKQTQPQPRRPSLSPAGLGYYSHPARNAVITQRLHGYNAVDFGASYGSAVTAAAPGTVILSRNSGWNGGYGKYIVIDHPNGTQTLYAHNSQNIVSVGDSVVSGQVIGYMGSSGRSTGSHVHFEVRGASNPFSGCGLRTQCR